VKRSNPRAVGNLNPTGPNNQIKAIHASVGESADEAGSDAYYDEFAGGLIKLFWDLPLDDRKSIACSLRNVALAISGQVQAGFDLTGSGEEPNRAGEESLAMHNLNPNDIKCPGFARSAQVQDAPAAKPKRRVKAPRNYFMVNLSNERIEKLRALGQCAGTDLKSAFRGIALVELQRVLELHAGVSIDQAFKLTRAQRKRLGATRISMLRLLHIWDLRKVN
jgi:hypothetical protein